MHKQKKVKKMKKKSMIIASVLTIGMIGTTLTTQTLASTDDTNTHTYKVQANSQGNGAITVYLKSHDGHCFSKNADEKSATVEVECHGIDLTNFLPENISHESYITVGNKFYQAEPSVNTNLVGTRKTHDKLDIFVDPSGHSAYFQGITFR